MARQPIIFDFVHGRAYRADSATSLSEALTSKVSKATRPRVVKTIIGVPPGVLAQPKK